MKILTGTALHNMDAKNRIRIPAKYKAEFAKTEEELHFVLYSEGAIAIMTDSVLAKRFDAFTDADASDEELLMAKRFFMSCIEDIEEDGQGRITLSKRVREYIGADKENSELISVGMGNYVELWVYSRYKEVMAGMTVTRANGIAKEKKDQKGQ